jgi:uncharacterized protein
MYHSYPWSSPAISAATPLCNHRPIIEVTGVGTVAAAPNEAVIVLGVITESPSLSKAQAANASSVTHVINALLQLSIQREHMQTVTYRIEIQYRYEDGIQTLKGYRVEHLLQITIDQVERAGLVVDTAVHNGANTVSSIRFTLTHPETYYNQALSKAIQNAGTKALTIAQTLGLSLFQTPIIITEETRAGEPPVPFQALLSTEGSAAPTPIQPGELEIRAAIKVRYAYV